MNENKMTYISLKNLSKTYFTPAGDVAALDNLTVDIQRGSFVGVIGKSGAGKSTLVNLLTGVDRMTAGELWVDGNPIHQFNQEKMTKWRGQNVGVIYQSFELLNQLSVLDNVLIPVDLCGNYSPLRSPEEGMKLLEAVEIAEHARKSPALISGGQRQRVAIARALANDPQLIIADEPTGSLDSVTSEVILSIFDRLVSEGKTIIMVTHDKNLAPRFDHLLTLEDGKIIRERRKNHG